MKNALFPGQRIKVPGKFRWAIVLFGLIFFMTATGFLVFLVAPDLYDAFRMQSWQATQGKILAVDTRGHRSANTFEASAKYEYEVNGRLYQNNRLGISSGADNIGDYQQKLQQQLRLAFQTHSPIRVWYNPDNPAESVIDHQLRWGLIAFKMIFVLLFGSIGFMVLYFSFKGGKTPPPLSIEKQQPWLARPEWKNGAIKSNARTGMVAAWSISLFWNGISYIVTYQALPEILNKQEPAGYIVFLFPLIGLSLWYWAIKATLQWKRFGITLLTMDPYPGSIGGQVGGVIKVRTAYKPEQLYKVTLSCIHSYMSGSGKNRSRRESISWQDQGYARINPRASELDIEFCFDVPDKLPASEPHSDSYHFWQLTLESSMDGLDLSRNFEIPVYPTAVTSQYINFTSPHYQPLGVNEVTAESLLPLKQSGFIKELYYPILRKPLGNFSGILFGGIFAAIGVFLWQQAATAGGMLYFMGAIFAGIGGLVVIAAIYSAFTSLYLKFDGQILHYQQRFMGFCLHDRKIPYSDISSIIARKSSAAHVGGKHKIEYKIFARVKAKTLMLAESIDSASKKDQLVAYFQQEISL